MPSNIPAVFVDWAGTAIDHGSVAPGKALEDTFAGFGLSITPEAVRRYMGLAKKDHIRKVLEEPEARAQWQALHHRGPEESDVEQIYAQLEPRMMEALEDYATVISGAAEAVAEMRARGMKIAGTTGYTRPMLDRLEALAAEQGYRTDRSLAPGDVGAGRPYPFMIYRLAADLHIYPLANCVKIGDTESDIAEGLNAGMWTIGLTRCGNAVGLSEAEWRELDPGAQAKLIEKAEDEMHMAGAHFTAESLADTLPVLDEIAQHIASGSSRTLQCGSL